MSASWREGERKGRSEGGGKEGTERGRGGEREGRGGRKEEGWSEEGEEGGRGGRKREGRREEHTNVSNSIPNSVS